MHNYKLIPNMVKLNSFDKLNDILKPYGARITTKDKCLQSKAKGYYGYFWSETSKPVYDFSIVSIADGKSFANLYSDIYRQIPSEILREVAEYFIETKQVIYA